MGQREDLTRRLRNCLQSTMHPSTAPTPATDESHQTEKPAGSAPESSAQASGAPPLLRLNGVTKRFRRKGNLVVAVDDVDLSIPQGQFICIVGPSGCGKSTLLNMAAGLMQPSAGEVLYEGKPVPLPNTSAGYITQKDTLLPWRTAGANIGLVGEIQSLGREETKRRVAEVIDLVGLAGFEDAYPGELSGGMKRRVILARTLVYDPEVLLADEPFGALDAQLKLVLQDELQRICAATNKTVLFVTHDIAEAITLGDRVLVMSARPGRIKSDRLIDLPRPRDTFNIRFKPEFGRLFEQLWETLADDVRAGEAM